MSASKWKPYSEYKSCKVGWIDRIPSEWVVKKLGRSFSSIGSGTTPNSSNENNYMNGTIPWVNTGELRENWIFDTEKKITEKAFNENSMLKMYPEGALLVAMYGATIGRLGWLGISSTVNQAVCCFSGPIDINAEFVYFWLLVNKKDYIEFYSSGGGQPNVNQEKLCNLRIPTPDLSTQEKIVELCQKIDDRISTSINNLETQLSLLEEKRSALITQAVTKGLNPNVTMKDTGIDWIGEIPIHWQISKFPYCVNYKEGPGILAVDFREQGVPLLRIRNLKPGCVDLFGCNFLDEKMVNQKWKQFKVAEGDLLISGSASIGFVSVVDMNSAGSIPYTGIFRLRAIKGKIISNYVEQLVLSDAFLEQIQVMMTGSTIQHFGPSHLSEIVVALPPINEQIEISNFILEKAKLLDLSIQSILQQIEKLNEYRTALISAAVTGKIDVRESV